ncbi:MAG TPA: DNA polymerase IV [Methylibium sp.]|uniref:DNA polymerase IV n=1 Tax=Methylibium sp. TaxID=2067992 RepID=UPI002DBE0DE6|nr:DNA polymerase IV [Methylibium sp.]HEU4459870.1 DNA polymerase IV [Methylibium sp.]
MSRLIAHLDMDAFYASVELLRYPELAGQPVVIGGGRRHQPTTNADGSRSYSTLRQYAGRGVVMTATYPARAFGLSSGMGLMKAAALAPDALLLPTDFEAYRHHSRLFKAAVAEVVGTEPPVIEDRGIDEIYIDLTAASGGEWRRAEAIARHIKARVFERTGLTCSIGVTPNKLLSKLASELDKPDGLTLLGFDDLPTRIWPMPARRINGIGPKCAAKLAALGIRTIGELAAADPAFLLAHFGRRQGAWLHEAAHGRDERAVSTRSDPVGMSRETTFDRDLHPRGDRVELGAIFTKLCEQVAGDLRRKGYVGRSIGIKLRFDDFRIVTRDTTLAEPTDDAATIRRAAGACLKRAPLERRLRLLGVRVASLRRADVLPPKVAEPPAPYTPSLFDAAP